MNKEKLNTMKYLVMIVMGFVFANSLQAQQEPLLSRYMFNGLFINPAYAGSHDYWTSSHTFRKQWVGFDGSPQTIISAVDGPIPGQNMGLGAVFFNDQIGVTKQNTFMVNYSYQLKFKNTDAKLAFGTSAGISQYSAKLTDLVYWDESDPVFENDLNSRVIPKMGFGVYYYTDRWFAGFSIPTLLAYQKGKDFSINVNNGTFLHRHYLLSGGYVFDLNDDFKIRPTVLFKYLPNAPFQADINAAISYKDAFWFGVSYRSGDAMSFLVEYQSNMFFRVGYAYDLTVSQLRNYSHGSHEIMIGIDFGKELKKVKHVRYF